MDGEILNDQYYNYMEKLAANKAKQWKYPSTDAALLEMLNDNTYNYRAMYNKYGNSDTKHEGHFSDEFKTAFHPTFSTDSIYSGKRSQFNPTGIKGGVWVKPYQDHRGNTQYEQYYIGDRMWTPGFSLDRTRNYLNNAEINNVMMLPGYPKFNIGKPDNANTQNTQLTKPVRPRPVPRPSKQNMDSISDQDWLRIHDYDVKMKHYQQQMQEYKKQQKREASLKRQSRQEAASRQFDSYRRAMNTLEQGVKTDIATGQAVADAAVQSQKDTYDNARMYRYLFKLLPYVVPTMLAGGSLSLDGINIYRKLKKYDCFK